MLPMPELSLTSVSAATRACARFGASILKDCSVKRCPDAGPSR